MVAWCSLLSPFTENGVRGCVEVCEGMWGVHARMHTRVCMHVKFNIGYLLRLLLFSTSFVLRQSLTAPRAHWFCSAG